MGAYDWAHLGVVCDQVTGPLRDVTDASLHAPHHWGPLVTQRQAVGQRLPAALAERCLSTLLPAHQAASQSKLVTVADARRRTLGKALPE
eukprot:2321829-Rhodomonas_salina.1